MSLLKVFFSVSAVLLLSVEAVQAKPPERVVTLIPSVAELALDIGLPESQLVGVSQYTDYPKSLKTKPSIGSYQKPSIERILELKPDLVIGSRDGTSKEAALKLQKLNIRVVQVGTESLADIREAYVVLGKSLNREDSARAALKKFEDRLAAVVDKAILRPNKSVVRVLLQVGEDPLIVAAGKTFLSEGLTLLKAQNIYPVSSQSYPRVSVEDVLKKNPSVIVLISSGGDGDRFERAKRRWQGYPGLHAGKNGKVIILHSDSLVRPGPRFPEGLAALDEAIFGAAAP